MGDQHGTATKVALLTGVSFLVGAAGAAEAAPLPMQSEMKSFTLGTFVDVTGISTPTTDSDATSVGLTFDLFDGTLGTLTEVKISLFTETLHFSGQLTINVSDYSEPASATAAYAFTEKVTVTGSPLTEPLFEETDLPDPNSLSVDDLDTSKDFDTFDDFYDTFTTGDAGDLAFFTNGGGDFTIDLMHVLDLTTSGDRNFDETFAEGTSFWGGDITVKYTYDVTPTPVPVPGALPLFGSALAAGAFAAARRKRKSQS